MSTTARSSALRVRRYQPDDLAAVERLNARFREAGIEHVVYAENQMERGATERASWVRDRLFVAAQDDEIRAGVWLKEQDFWARGATVRAGWAKYPVSESLIDRKFAGIPGSLLFQLLREQPRLMALGLGGHDGAFARFLAGMRWPGLTIPFFVKVVRPARVARELHAIRTTPARRLLLDMAAYSGLAWAGASIMSSLEALKLRARPSGYASFIEPAFAEWADIVWINARNEYGFVATRDSAALEQIYTGQYRGVSRLRVERNGTLVGWALAPRMDGTRPGAVAPFGKLVVGAVADCFAAPEHAAGVADEATRSLLAQGVDLLITHQSHPTWVRAFEHLGWRGAPSNFAFYRAPAVEAIAGDAIRAGSYHLTRGDCDGLMRV
ncbi:MAG: hypothetical protein ACT4PJ_17025 [Gemmatimonadaceae bacterium]